MSALAHCKYDSPVGLLTLVSAGGAALQAIWWPDDPRPVDIGDHDEADPVLRAARAQLDEYFAGQRKTFELPLSPIGTEFQHAAWAVLRHIPYGNTITYGEQARRLGDVRKSRAVGAANAGNPLSIVVPCHRVVAASGALTGFAGGLDRKQWLLEFERGELIT